MGLVFCAEKVSNVSSGESKTGANCSDGSSSHEYLCNVESRGANSLCVLRENEFTCDVSAFSHVLF